MKRFLTKESNYDKRPAIRLSGHACQTGWKEIAEELNIDITQRCQKKTVVVAECYPGVFDEELLPGLTDAIKPEHIFMANTGMKCPCEIDRLVYPDATDDRIFGRLTRLKIDEFFDNQKVTWLKKAISDIQEGVILVYGTGASLFAEADILIYADMPRWEGQLRFRRNEVSNLGVENKLLEASLQYKRAYFVDWRVCDRLKKTLINQWDYVLDTTIPGNPKMVTGVAIREGLEKVVTRPFRVVPFFDPGPWGGQWMKEVCDLDRSQVNYAWCFDCVPEENSLLFSIGNTQFEIPSINLVFFKPKELLGEAVHGRFGDEFPIRFDFLDTMDGGNLSLQVHPLTEYIREHFGMHYTQDESYYILDAAEGAHVYLGLKDDINPQLMIQELQSSQQSGTFNADKHVNKWAVQKHDHILIPAGTVHCSGSNSMVLEISATPYIFTFKLWDWGRMGLDGKPRPININHGEKVIQWDYTTSWTKDNLINTVEKLDEGDGWFEERTGLHEREFIETRRHWFSKKVNHDTHGTLNVLNLIEGREAIVESPANKFDPFIVHYAETFIIPASVGAYTISPYGDSKNERCATIKAFVRTQP